MWTLTLALLAPARAQNPADWVFDPSPVLEPDPTIAWASQSISNPSVVYDSVHHQYLMFFESRTTQTDTRCPHGIWDVGFATSPDGVSWAIDPTPFIAPNPNNSAVFYNCVAAHPTVYFSEKNWGSSVGHVYVYFKAEQYQPACSGSGTKSWGCGPYTGIGVAIGCFDGGGNPYRCQLTNRPALYNTNNANTTIGNPHVIHLDGTWRMALGVYPDVYEAHGSSYTSLTRDSTPTLQQSTLKTTIPWIVDEIFNPSLNCDDDLTGNMDLAMFVGGRDLQNSQTVTGSWGKAVSDRSVISYVLDSTPQQSWTGNDQWKHWEVRKLTNADGEYVVYFDEKDASGNNFVRMGTTDPSLTWNDSDFGGWHCN